MGIEAANYFEDVAYMAIEALREMVAFVEGSAENRG